MAERDELYEDIAPEEAPPEPKRRRNVGCAIFGWVLFLCALALICLLAYRTSVYYGAIKRGELVHLPQYKSAFTRSGKAQYDIDSVPRASIENAESAATGASEKNAKLTIVEFADFECPYSKEASTTVRTIAAKYADRVRVIYRHYPLETIHTKAMDSALASACAQEQGKFWAYHDRAYLNSPALDSAALLRFARESGLDAVQFDKCFTERRYEARVKQDAALAESLGVAGTPTFFFNGRRVEGAIPAAEMERLVQEMTAN